LASIINASNSGFGGIVSTGDSSGVLQLQAAGTTIATIQSTGLNLGSNGVVFSDSSSQTAAASPYVLKNRIINGDMRIDQRNAGASVTPTTDGQYTLDRWKSSLSVTSKFSVQQNAAAVTPPTGFTNYLGVTSLSAYSIGTSDYFGIRQKIEGFNVADLNWGTANAQTVTLSFWVRSSLTGTFGGTLANSAQNRNYPFSYTIASANTWEQKTITIAGDTSGTWLTTNGIGVGVQFGLGVGSTYSGTAGSWTSSLVITPTGATSVVGTNGATWYITGVQLEIGTSATPFERRLYGQELINCQRYYWQLPASNTYAAAMPMISVGQAWSSTNTANHTATFPVSMRTTPTLFQSGLKLYSPNLGGFTATISIDASSKLYGAILATSGSTGLTGGAMYNIVGSSNATDFIGFGAEL